ncbi:hypothetical protein ACNJ7E_13030 [Rhodococcus sp. NM-2]|uniref:hypothetical protein n=1 Tax=Rhodococcus sp. NM-2 TaxID=3401174 RepID=UPI003AAD26E7
MIRWRIEHDYRKLKTRLELDITTSPPGSAGTTTPPKVTAAHLFPSTLRLTHPESVGQDWPSAPLSENFNAHLFVRSYLPTVPPTS